MSLLQIVATIAASILLCGCTTPESAVKVEQPLIDNVVVKKSSGVVRSGIFSSPAPTPFKLGNETKPPVGCVEARTRGIDC